MRYTHQNQNQTLYNSVRYRVVTNQVTEQECVTKYRNRKEHTGGWSNTNSTEYYYHEGKLFAIQTCFPTPTLLPKKYR